MALLIMDNGASMQKMDLEFTRINRLAIAMLDHGRKTKGTAMDAK